jgi:CheY-like chemotaxis protein
VLAADDEADAVSLVADLLDAAGDQVTIARSEDEALRHLKQPGDRADCGSGHGTG